MAKDFPDSSFAYHPPAEDAAYVPPVVKIIPTVPAAQAERPQLRPVIVESEK